MVFSEDTEGGDLIGKFMVVINNLDLGLNSDVVFEVVVEDDAIVGVNYHKSEFVVFWDISTNLVEKG